ncbi:polysaccharide deacetylase family protein [Bacillus sp. H-16]|uniref:polysaccharide deacetylase family protein n=1 Tax=Alteribacter salitolerans TaxID=2912333 RepID=UPI0019656201|nr:polysaccharide deacetylase family protein [Alteribacter salitolerans]
MKKVVGGLTVAALLVTACGDENGNEEETVTEEDTYEETTDNEESEGAEGQGGDEDEDLADDDQDLHDETDEEEELEEESETEVTHQMASDHTVQPLDGNNSEQVVLLTIDDAPADHGLEMAQTLAELDAGAIFFVNGHFLQSEDAKDQLRGIHELGFEIGNHTMNHPNMSHLTEEEQYAEIIELNELVEEIIGERPRFYRAPFGVNTDYSKQLIEEEGMQWMNWTYGYDYEADYMEADPLAEIMVETELLRNGANLLMHDRSFTSEALEDIVNGLREKGYEPIDPEKIE